MQFVSSIIVALFAVCQLCLEHGEAFSVTTKIPVVARATNTKLPYVDLHFGFPPDRVNIAKYGADKKMILVGLPGAFTPTCSSIQIPGYLKNQEALKDAGIDVVVICSVNDGAVMNAWAIDQGIQGSLLLFMGDPYSELTKALDMEITHPGPISKGLVGRCKRFALYAENSVIKYMAVSESDDDPAGDADPSATCWEAMLDAIKQLPSSTAAAAAPPISTSPVASY